MTKLTELSLKREQQLKDRQKRIAEIEAMPDDDPVEADKLIPVEDREKILKILERIAHLQQTGKLKK